MASERLHFTPMLLRPFWAVCIGVVMAAASVTVFAQSTVTSPQSTETSQSSSQKTPAAASGNIAVPLPKGKKLILKDGTFQMVREYHRQGDSVRYYSVERSAWEEIPAELVDWDATQKGEAEQEAQDRKLVEKLKAADLAARTADIDSDSSFEARPGLLLPDGVGLYALSGGAILTMAQNLAVSHLSKGLTAARMATGIPLIPAKHNIEIPGKHAKLRVRSDDLEFYFRTADGRVPDMQLLRTEIQGDKRKLVAMSTNVVGINNYKGDEVRIQVWDAAQGLYRFTVEQALSPGEYALIENNPEGDISLYVWDFGIDAVPGVGDNSASEQNQRAKK